mmetsp:Transcript_113025/g.364970  ORF Transcript_113025/g.364970 Transcript_113025/m.364970 type:complete len:382 (-) Transcript_113025:831-1976(-)
MMISSSSRFSMRRSWSMPGRREPAKCCDDSRQSARLLRTMTHSSTTSSSEKLGTRSLVRSSTRPASQSSHQGMSGSVMFPRVPSTSTSRSGLSTPQSAMRANSCIHLDIRTLSLYRRSHMDSMTPWCEETWRMTLQSRGSLVLSTRSITCGKRPLPTITSAARGCVARFTTRATRSLPTRCSGKCTTSCKSMTMPSRWYAMRDLQLSSMEKWYKSRRTMCRKGGFLRWSTSSFMMLASLSTLRTLSSNDRLYTTLNAREATFGLGCCASSTRRSSVTVSRIFSLFSSKTLSFLRNCSVVISRSSQSRCTSCTSSAGILRFTIFRSMEISSARFSSAMTHTCMSLLCLLICSLYFFSSLAKSFLSSFVAVSPSCCSRMRRRS